MRKNPFLASVYLSLVMAAAPTAAVTAQESREPTGLLEVDRICCYEVTFRLRHDREGLEVRGFNQGRPYAISINEQLPDARAARARMALILEGRGRLREVVTDWFGEDVPDRLNIMIGGNVPVEIAQAALASYAVDAKIPVFVSLVDEDVNLNESRRVYIGGLLDFGEAPMPTEKIRELLKPDLSREKLAKLLPQVGTQVLRRAANRPGDPPR